MKRVIMGTILALFFNSCNSNSQEKKISQIDVIGTWRSSEKAELIFKNNGVFIGSQIPAEFGFFPADSFANIKFSGSGKWELKKGASHWEIMLDFTKVTGVDKNGCSFPLLIAGENGILENKPPWYLFAWMEEEGGERYKFFKR
jgi:hypothetical protein